MVGQQDGDMTDQDPLSSAAEGDDDPGTAALAEAGTGEAGENGDAADGQGPGPDDAPTPGPPPEALDDTPVTDAVPEENLGFPEG